MPDVYVHCSAFPIKCISPDMIQQPVTGKHHALMFQQQTQQFKFFQRQANGFFAHSDNVTGRVHIQITQYIFLLLFARSRPPQNRFDTGNQCHHAKRFRDVIICTIIQAHYLIVFCSLCGQHNHRQRFRCPICP